MAFTDPAAGREARVPPPGGAARARPLCLTLSVHPLPQKGTCKGTARDAQLRGAPEGFGEERHRAPGIAPGAFSFRGCCPSEPALARKSLLDSVGPLSYIPRVSKLRRLREQKGYSIRGLAKVARLDWMTVWRVETGRRAPTVATLRKLARALKVEVADLL